MIPSRPKTVLNHGTPAYGYGPSGLPSTNVRRSAEDRVSQESKLSLDVVIRQSSSCAPSEGELKLENATGNERGSGRSVSCSQATKPNNEYSKLGCNAN